MIEKRYSPVGFSDRLELEIGKINLSYNEVARRLKISSNSLDRYRLEGTPPDITILFRMCKLFGVSADYLLGI